MANRSTRFILKNNDNATAPFSGATLYAGEPIVNTAAGIMMFSGKTGGSAEWTSAGDGAANSGGNNNFFEVGSNLYNLKIRNKITSYGGASLVGKFLSGTTSGFVLADISSIVGVDTYVTNFSYDNNNVLTLDQNNAGTDFTVLINQMSGLTVNGTLSATTGNFGTTNINTLNATGGTITTLGSTTINVNQLNATAGTITTLDSTTINTNQINATAGTITTLSSTTINGGNLNLTGGIQSYSGLTNVAGQFLSGTSSGFALAPISAITGVDTSVTAFTYTPSSNTFTVFNSNGNNYPATINSVTGLTVTNLNAGRVVYVGTGGLLTDESGFEYNTSNNTLSVDNINAASNVVIQGNLTVFGAGVSAFTSELYVEDYNVILNYNPTGNTENTSLGAGWTIQNGNGLSAVTVNDVHLNINRLDTLTGTTFETSRTPAEISAEYPSSTGFANRGWITELNDIVIRSNDVTIPNGVRVLAEFDTLDGGQY